LSPSSILKLKADWQQEYEAWKKRPLRGQYVYLYADGLYLKAGAEQDKTALLVVLGVDEHGHKELLAMESGYRESAASWSEVLRSLKQRGLTEAPRLAIGDGALGFWAALDEVFPTTRHQRCWNHRVLNVLDKLPKRLHPEVRKRLRALAEASTRQDCERRRDALCAWLRGRGQEPAAACLERDWADFVTFYSFPELCRYRHNSGYAARPVMPRALIEVAANQFSGPRTWQLCDRPTGPTWSPRTPGPCAQRHSVSPTRSLKSKIGRVRRPNGFSDIGVGSVGAG
jgi:transposase-like protein